MTKTTTSSLVTAGLFAAMSLGSTAIAAPASHGGDAVRANGGCSGFAVWKLKAKPDNGALEVEFEVDSNVSGQVWKVRLKDNGDRFFAGKRTTAGASGSFSVHQTTANRAGNDVIRARAVHGDEICLGTITV